MRVTPLGLCLKVIVHEKTQNLEKTTSGVLSVLLLIYGYDSLKTSPGNIKYLRNLKTKDFISSDIFS